MVEVLTGEVFNHFKIIKLPQLRQLLFIDCKHKSFVVALVLVNDLWLAQYSHYLCIINKRLLSLLVWTDSLWSVGLSWLLETIKGRFASSVPDETITIIVSYAGHRVLLLVDSSILFR